MSPLTDHLRQLIRREGPLTVARYMAECLGHPRYGYYMTRDPLGRAGDFITAPEVSQMFGELLGAWTAAVWQALGSPAKLAVLELGPGHGTLLADALRVLARLPGLMGALSIHLVEISPVLRTRQQAALRSAAAPLAWHDSVTEALAAAADSPTVVLANEFIDALPIHQLVQAPTGWRERLIICEDAGFAFALDSKPTPLEALIPPHLRAAPPGSVVEVAPAALDMTGTLAAHLLRVGGAALLIDYGYETPALGDTLQAMRGHAYAPVLDTPGEADLTAHVDFAALADAARSKGARALGPVPQGAFLDALGLAERAARLSAANPAAAHDVAAAYDRLTSPQAMGTLFKVLALASPGLPLPGFPA